MEKIPAQCQIFWALDSKRKLDSPKVSMWPLDGGSDTHIPYLRFYFAGEPLDSPVYHHLVTCLHAYQGLTQWACLCNPARSRNYFLLPQAFAPYLFTHGVYKERLLSVMEEQVYRENTLVAKGDAPNLSRYIEQNWMGE